MTKPKIQQIRAYLRSFDYTDDGMAETEDLSGAVETGDYVRTSDYLLMRNAAEAELDQLRAALVVAQRHMHECEFPVDHYARSAVDEALGGLPLMARRAAEPEGERECALQDIAYRNGAQQAIAMAHQSLKAADEWLAGLWERTREARSVLNRGEKP